MPVKCSVMCMCVRVMCMCARVMCMCVRVMCMCVRVMCMCVRVVCMCVRVSMLILFLRVVDSMDLFRQCGIFCFSFSLWFPLSCAMQSV